MIFGGRLIRGPTILDVFLINSWGGRLIRGSAYTRVRTVFLNKLVYENWRSLASLLAPWEFKIMIILIRNMDCMTDANTTVFQSL